MPIRSRRRLPPPGHLDADQRGDPPGTAGDHDRLSGGQRETRRPHRGAARRPLVIGCGDRRDSRPPSSRRRGRPRSGGGGPPDSDPRRGPGRSRACGTVGHSRASVLTMPAMAPCPAKTSGVRAADDSRRHRPGPSPRSGRRLRAGRRFPGRRPGPSPGGRARGPRPPSGRPRRPGRSPGRRRTVAGGRGSGRRSVPVVSPDAAPIRSTPGRTSPSPNPGRRADPGPSILRVPGPARWPGAIPRPSSVTRTMPPGSRLDGLGPGRGIDRLQEHPAQTCPRDDSSRPRGTEPLARAACRIVRSRRAIGRGSARRDRRWPRASWRGRASPSRPSAAASPRPGRVSRSFPRISTRLIESMPRSASRSSSSLRTSRG